MKKLKLFTSILVASTMLCACGGSATETTSAAVPTETSAAQASEESIGDSEDAGDIEVDTGLFDVEITVPADFIGETTQEELDAEAAESGMKIVLNDDGSATYTMTKQQHKKMMDEIRNSINQSMTEMIGSEEYPNFTNLEANDDFTSFTITTSATEVGLTDGLSVLGFYMYGGLYNVFNGTPVDNIHVDFVNADTGEIISSSDSNEMQE